MTVSLLVIYLSLNFCYIDKYFPGHPCSENSSENGQSFESEVVCDTAKYRGYLALNDSMNAILSCAKLYDQQGPYHQQSGQCRSSNSSHMPMLSEEYNTEVMHRLDSARQHVQKIFPLDFRYEIIENIYSLIFVRSEHLSETGLSSFGSHQTIDPFEIKSEKIESEQRLSSDRISINGVLKKQGGLLNVHIVNNAFSENGRSTVLQYGFLATTIVIRDILTMIQDCLNEFDSSIQERSLRNDTLRKRANELRRHVEESLWRLGVLTFGAANSVNHLSQVHVQRSESDDESGRIIQ